MTADKSTPVMPGLRFPEFRRAGVWHFRPLSDIAAPISSTVGTTKCVPMSVMTGVGLVSQQEKFGRTIAGDSYKNYIRIQTNDLAYNKSATKEFPQGYIARYSGTKDAAVPNSIFTCFRPDTAVVIPEYLDHLFHANHHGRWLRKYITVGARAHGALGVSDDDLMSMPVPLPPVAVSRPEQQKIADCLGSLVDLVAAEGRKLDVLRQHKQGLMQQLFPQIGQTTPRLRFSVHATSPGWANLRLSHVLVEHEMKNDGNCEVHSVSVQKGLVNQVEHLGRSFAASDTSKYNLVQPRDVVYTKSPTGKFPFGIVKQSQLEYSAAVSPLYGVFTPINEHVGYIIEAYFESPSRANAYLAPISHKGAKNTIQISNDTFLSGSIMLPTGSEEQRGIAAFLSGMNTMISAHEVKVGALRRLKQGLLQQLFPRLEVGSR